MKPSWRFLRWIQKWHEQDLASLHKTLHNSWFQKQLTWFKKQQKEQLYRFDMISNTQTFYLAKFISRIIIFCLYIIFSIQTVQTTFYSTIGSKYCEHLYNTGVWKSKCLWWLSTANSFSPFSPFHYPIVRSWELRTLEPHIDCFLLSYWFWPMAACPANTVYRAAINKLIWYTYTNFCKKRNSYSPCQKQSSWPNRKIGSIHILRGSIVFL